MTIRCGGQKRVMLVPLGNFSKSFGAMKVIDKMKPLTRGICSEHGGAKRDLPVEGRGVFVDVQGGDGLCDIPLSDGSVIRAIQSAGNGVRPCNKLCGTLQSARAFVLAEDGRRF